MLFIHLIKRFGWCTLSVIQVMEKNFLLIMVIMLEEIQSKPVVCVQLFLWNILDLLRYAHHLFVSSFHFIQP